MSTDLQAAGRLNDEKAAAKRWPPQIKYIIGNEACERFSYYGIRSILALYISKILFSYLPEGVAKDKATEIIHLFIFANYFTPLLGGWLSDKFWGRYNTILYISFIYCLGNLILAFGVGSPWGLYLGLAFIALGSGGIKPCVSAFCGDQFRPDQSELLQRAFGLFYWSINFGSFFSFLVIPWLKDEWGYRLAFGVPGILMLVATLIFWLGRKHYMRMPSSRQTKSAGFLSVTWYAWSHLRPAGTGSSHILGGVFLMLAGLLTLGLTNHEPFHPSYFSLLLMLWAFAGAACSFARKCRSALLFCLVFIGITGGFALVGLMVDPERILTRGGMGCAVGILALWSLARQPMGRSIWDTAKVRFSEREVDAARSVGPILAVFAPICIFWALFDQTSSTWVMQGNKMVQFQIPHLFVIGAEQMQSMNPAMVMILVPLALWLYPRIERWTGVRVSPLRRMGSGMVFASSAYVIVGLLQTRVDAGAHLSVLWQTLPYFILTTAEVLISTTGLEFAFTQAAAEMKSTITSFWLLTVAIGNLFVPIITQIQSHLIKSGPGESGSASVNSSTFYLYAGLTFFVALVFMAIASAYKERKLELTSAHPH